MDRGQPPRLLLPNNDVLLLVFLVAGLAGAWYLAGLAPRTGPGVRLDGPTPEETFIWTAEPGPLERIAIRDPDAIRDDIAAGFEVIETDRDDLFSVSLLAVYPSGGDAEAAAETVRDLLRDIARWFDAPSNRTDAEALESSDDLAPITGPEVDALEAEGLESAELGSGWGGDAADADAAVRVVDRWLIVSGLKNDQALTEYPNPAIPLVQLLRQSATTVLVEGDRHGEGTILADLSCRIPDVATGQRLRAEIASAIDVGGQYHAIPPWVRPPTDDEALARMTITRFSEASLRAMDDPRVSSLLDRFIGSPQSAWPALNEELADRIAELAPHLIDGPVDPDVLGALLSTAGSLTDPEAQEARIRAVGEHIGAYPLIERANDYWAPASDDLDTLLYWASSRVQGDRLELGYLSGARFSVGGVQLLAYLADAGCEDFRFALFDYEDYRVD